MGINPSLNQAVSLACSTGKRVAMLCSASRPSRGWGGKCHDRRQASCPQTSLVGRSSPQPSNHASRASSRTPDDVPGCRKRQLQPFPRARSRSQWGATKRYHVYVSDATPGLICEWMRAHSSGRFADQVKEYLLIQY